MSDIWDNLSATTFYKLTTMLPMFSVDYESFKGRLSPGVDRALKSPRTTLAWKQPKIQLSLTFHLHLLNSDFARVIF